MELVVLALLAMAGLTMAAIVGFVFFLLKVVFWVVFFPIKMAFWLVFPIRLLFKLMWLPLGLAFGTLGMGLGIIALPLIAVFVGGILVVSLVGAIIGLMIPAIPFVLLGLLLWSMFRKRPAVA